MLIHRHRHPLHHTRAALTRGDLTVGFIGGSITDGRSGHNWPEPVVAWLVESFPRALIRVENAAIGATGSALGVFRAQRDLIDRDCNLVFVEYAVNDLGVDAEERMRSREGLLRKLLATGTCDVVLVYTFSRPMYDDMVANHVPSSIADLEALGVHYGIGSVWMGLHAMREVSAGRMRWEEWLPDGLHPQLRGSLSYGQSVMQFLERELLAADLPVSQAVVAAVPLPAPLNQQHWQSARTLPLDQVQRRGGPWSLRRSVGLTWMDMVLETSAPGAAMAFQFSGRTLCLGLDFGKMSADFRWRLDGGEWQDYLIDRPDWCGNSGWYRLLVLASDLPDGTHSVELETFNSNRESCKGTNFRLATIGIV